MKADKLKTTTIVTVLLMVAIGALGGLLYLLFEIREVQIDKGYNQIARKNPFHAATLFLNQLGIQTTVVRGYKDIENLSQMDGTIVITDSRKHLPRDQNEKLLNWVKQGGTLLLFAEPPSTSARLTDLFNGDSDQTENDVILSEAGVRIYQIESEADTNQPVDATEDASQCVPSKALQTTCVELFFTDIEKPLHIAFSTNTAMEDTSGKVSASVGSGQGLHLLQYNIGDGLLTFFTDLEFWKNESIQQNDHAFFLELFMGDSEHVWFLSQGHSLSLMQLLWKYAKLVILWLVMGLTLLFWKSSRRFGPLLPTPRSSNRKLMEHITASSRFLWRKKEESHMIGQLRDYVNRRMQKKQPGYEAADANQRIELILRATHLPGEEVRQAFQNRNLYSKSEFLKTVKALQKIGNKL